MADTGANALRRYGIVEAGGTKFMLGVAECAVGAAAAPGRIIAQHRIPTLHQSETLPAMRAWFISQRDAIGTFDAFGVASFGPLDADRASPTWGHITRTTKPGWDNADLCGGLIADHGCPVGFDTDVNGAALAEARWGAGIGQRVSIYLTIGTGVGGGVMVDGALLRGLSHPEMGHIRLPREAGDADFAGVCPFHGDCLEGLASGPAIIARWGASLSELTTDHPAHGIIAGYLAQAACTLQAIFEPGRIIFGGGVMGTPGLLDRVRNVAGVRGAGYFVGDASDVIAAPALGDAAGLQGAVALALHARAMEHGC